MAYPADIIPCLFGNILCEIVRQIVDVARKHQILPYDKTVLVAKIVKSIGRIIAAAPYTYRVEVTLYRGL